MYEIKAVRFFDRLKEVFLLKHFFFIIPNYPDPPHGFYNKPTEYNNYALRIKH